MHDGRNVSLRNGDFDEVIHDLGRMTITMVLFSKAIVEMYQGLRCAVIEGKQCSFCSFIDLMLY